MLTQDVQCLSRGGGHVQGFRNPVVDGQPVHTPRCGRAIACDSAWRASRRGLRLHDGLHISYTPFPAALHKRALSWMGHRRAVGSRDARRVGGKGSRAVPATAGETATRDRGRIRGWRVAGALTACRPRVWPAGTAGADPGGPEPGTPDSDVAMTSGSGVPAQTGHGPATPAHSRSPRRRAAGRPI